MRIAVIASGRGSNLRTILELAKNGRLAVEPVLVLSNDPGAGALDFAAQYGIPAWSESHKSMPRTDFDAAMREAIEQSGAELVVLAGYMRLLGREFIRAFPGRIVNIHPAILPSFPGRRGGADALDYRVAITGCSVHFVDENTDSGPVIIQAAIPVSSEDTLEDLMPRIHAMEYRIYPQALHWIAQKRLLLQNRKVRLLPRAGEETKTRPPASTGPDWLVSPALEDF